MKIVNGEELLGRIPEKLDAKFMCAGYLHSEECEGDFTYYYRYDVNGGLVVDLEEQEVHWMTQEPKSFLEFLFAKE